MIWRAIWVSLAFNLALAVWLIAGLGSQKVSRFRGSAASVASDIRRAAENPAREVATNSFERLLTGFHWSSIESDDYREYVRNLRAIGCPEELVGDIVSADLAGRFVSRARRIWNPDPTPYWKKGRAQPNAREAKALGKLEQEHALLLKDLLGRDVKAQDLIDLLFLQSSQREHHLALLSPDRRARAGQALAQAGIGVNLYDVAQETPGGAKKALEEKLRVLRGVLSEPELKEYELRVSPVAERVRNDIRFMDATPEEFRRLVEVREKFEGNPPSDAYVFQEKLIAEATRALGEERGREYGRSVDFFYQWSREAAARFGLDEGAAEEAWRIKMETMHQAKELRADSALPGAERARSLGELRRQAEEQLREMLGPEALEFATRGDGWLIMLTEGGGR